MAELLDTVESAELTEWIAFDRIDPFGESRADLRAGIVASTMVNHSAYPPKPEDRARPVDFMPFRDKPKPKAPAPLDPETQSRAIIALLKSKESK